MDINFAVQSYRHDSLPISSQRCVNAYAESQPREAKSRVAVFGAPGIKEFARCGDGPIRAGIEINETAYFVSGSQFWSVDANGKAQLLGTGITGISPVSIDGTDEEICIVNGTNGYVYKIETKTLTQISDADFNGANTVSVVNSTFVYDWPKSNKFYISGVLKAGEIDPLDFASAESSPDQVIAVRNRNGLLFVYGKHTIEPWDHTGASDFPFAKIKGGTISRGIAAPLAIADEDSSHFCLGDDLVFYRIDGLQPRRISTHALEREWQSYTVTSDAFCFKMSFGGHKFIYLTFPSQNTTFGFDIATGLWHERVSWDPAGLEVKWRVNCAVFAYNKTLVGDANSGKIGILDPDTYTEFGDPIITTLISPPLFMEGRMMAVPSLEVDMQTGVGLVDGQGSEPHIMLEYSKDGGATFSAPQLWSTMGKIGSHGARIQWRELGSGAHWTFKLSISDPVKRVLTAARIPFLYAEPNQ